ncbi:hypothetical protein FHT02_002706 [Sphingomonas xinjiangensis]|uniref:Uncharacterized protein n=2 Tax=Sphingomonas xinjiangensis TaxID=643568 RepID=A0A840YNG0_9SPHN|nr:hypothetical protein [Sphingomonas xinjiangensis]
MPTIAQVLDRFDIPETVQLDRLVVDLGSFGPEELDAVPARLAERLWSALLQRFIQRNGATWKPGAGAMLDAFEHYLAQGTWPYGSGIDVRTAPDDILNALVEAEPMALVAMLRARGGSELLLRRLVRQMSDRMLAALLHRLEPVHAACVLGYVHEVQTSHKEEPVVPTGAEQLAEMLWTIVLRDALGQSGLQANRKAFLRRLLRSLAEASGTSLSSLLRQLRRGLVALGRRRRAPGSLVEILGQLMAEEPAMLVDTAALSRLTRYLFVERGHWPEAQLAEVRLIAHAVWRARPTEFAWLVRRLALTRSAGALARLEALLPLERAVQALWPQANRQLAVAVEQVPLETRVVALAALASYEAGFQSGEARPRAAAAVAVQGRTSGSDPTGAAAAMWPVRHSLDTLPAEPVENLCRPIFRGAAFADRHFLKRLAVADAGRLTMLAPTETEAEALIGQLLPLHLRRAMVALARAGGCRGRDWEVLIAVAAITDDTDPAELLLQRTVKGLAAHRGVPVRRLRRSLRFRLSRKDAFGPEGGTANTACAAGDTWMWPSVVQSRSARRLIERQRKLEQMGELLDIRSALSGRVWEAVANAMLSQLPVQDRRAIGRLMSPSKSIERVSISTPEHDLTVATSSRRRSKYALAAALRLHPLSVLELSGASVDAIVAAALDYAALTGPAKEHVLALGRRLTEYAGRRAVPAKKVAEALARALVSADWRAGSGDLAEEWLRQLAALASLSEQSALKRLLGDIRKTADKEQMRDAQATAASSTGLISRVGSLLDLGVSPRASAVRKALADPRRRAMLVTALTDGERAALLGWVAPGLVPGLLHVAERIGHARRLAGAAVPRKEQWLAILAAATSDKHAVMRLTGFMLDGGAGCPAPLASLRYKVETALARSLEGMRDAPLRIALNLRARARKAQAERTASEAAPDSAIWLNNAGLVLTSAYLPRLFEALEWIERDKGGGWRWASREIQERAPHLLQWLADGRSDTAEAELALPKLLCGLMPCDAIWPEVDLNAEELRIGRMLLGTIRANWPPLSESSPQALRETFLQRGGRLTKKPGGWALDIETKVLDILLDQLPWGFGMIAHDWMPAPLTVRWR